MDLNLFNYDETITTTTRTSTTGESLIFDGLQTRLEVAGGDWHVGGASILTFPFSLIVWSREIQVNI